MVSPESDGLDGPNSRTVDEREREALLIGNTKYDSDNKEKRNEANMTTLVDKNGGCSTNDTSN